jgi:hypothetical protein
MKKVILSVALMISAAMVFAQDRDRDRDDDRNRNYNDNRNYYARGDVPSNVWNSFHRDYPDVNDVRWQRNGRGWIAIYNDRNYNREIQSYYNRRGRRMDSHAYVDRRDLPYDFDRRFESRYHPQNGYQVYRIDRPGGPVVYQVILNDGNENRTIYTDQYGNEIRYRDRH